MSPTSPSVAGTHAVAATQERRALTSLAIRSMLLTVLSEHVMAHREEVWQETLVLALVELGNTRQAARQAVARSIRDDVLRSRRVARRARMSLTPRALEILTSGRARVRDFETPRGWDGTWLVLVMNGVDEHRQLRVALTRAGLGSLGGGVWLTPHHGREGAVASVLRATARHPEAISFRSSHGAIGTLADIAAAWPLDAVAARYREFATRYRALHPSAQPGQFAAHTRMVHEWRRMAFDDPDLPAAALPRAWPRERAYALYTSRERLWRDGARAHFAALETAVESAAVASRPLARARVVERAG